MQLKKIHEISNEIHNKIIQKKTVEKYHCIHIEYETNSIKNVFLI